MWQIGAITEFDDLFEVGCRSIVNALVEVNSPDQPSKETTDDDWLVANLEDVMEPLLRSWLAHSRTLRLSVLEQVLSDDAWKPLEQFIQKYGRDLFTQRFLNIGNLRGIFQSCGSRRVPSLTAKRRFVAAYLSVGHGSAIASDRCALSFALLRQIAGSNGV